MRDSFNGRTSVFQTENAGSIPASRTESAANTGRDEHSAGHYVSGIEGRSGPRISRCGCEPGSRNFYRDGDKNIGDRFPFRTTVLIRALGRFPVIIRT
jgi:hypothetical protein